MTTLADFGIQTEDKTLGERKRRLVFQNGLEKLNEDSKSQKN